MRLHFAGERVLAVVAHADDAEVLCAGTLARARADRAAVGICVLCQGDKGQPAPPVEDLTEVRRAEMQDAAALLGAEVMFGGFPDGELFDGAPERRIVIELIRHFRPTLLLAHAPEDYHPDHRAASALAETASWFCSSGGYRTAAAAMTAPPALWWMDTVNQSGFLPGFFVDVSEHMALKRRMLACHQSQLRRGADSAFASLDELMQQQCRSRGSQAGVAAAEAFRIHRAWRRMAAW
jgi:LmbE family N-acetylglucosaminyl deacetylase